MISVAEARTRIVSALDPVASETVSLANAAGRVLAEDVRARLTQPPAAVSAMDGYAVRAADVATPPATLKVIGEAPAGGAYAGTVGHGEAVRIFTGGPVPEGADAIVIQENASAGEGAVTVRVEAPAGHYIRPAGLDFRAGEVGLAAGRVLTARDIGLAAAMNVPWLCVRRRPRVALLATGDEIVFPGDTVGANQIISSNALALAALVTANGAAAIDLGITRDARDSLQAAAARAEGADLLITIGGASVGDHDLIGSALGEAGLAIDFWRIAMRPGKPLIFGRFRETAMLGLPGNPVSALVCGLVFVVPAVRALLGLTAEGPGVEPAVLGCDVAENDEREDYLRAAYSRDGPGPPCATPYEKQDSSMLSVLAMAECLVVRPPGAPAARAGAPVDVIPFRRGPTGF